MTQPLMGMHEQNGHYILHLIGLVAICPQRIKHYLPSLDVYNGLRDSLFVILLDKILRRHLKMDVDRALLRMTYVITLLKYRDTWGIN